jgi:superfamily I DNA and/or RNA helicase
MLLAMTNEIYDTVIIDEAAQAVEPSTLIPLKYSKKGLI